MRVREVLKLRWIRSVTSFSELESTDDVTVLLATEDLIHEGEFLYHTVIPEFYDNIRLFLTECGFLSEGQCEAHVDAGNGMRKIPVQSFKQVTGAIQRFDKQQKDDEPKFRTKIKKDENDALIAEISVSIDALQKKVSSLIGAVSGELRELYGFTKMS
jgi:hypothetical protein